MFSRQSHFIQEISCWSTGGIISRIKRDNEERKCTNFLMEVSCIFSRMGSKEQSGKFVITS